MKHDSSEQGTIGSPKEGSRDFPVLNTAVLAPLAHGQHARLVKTMASSRRGVKHMATPMSRVSFVSRLHANVRRLVFQAVLAFGLAMAPAWAMVIDFENLPLDDTVFSQYQGVGVTFPDAPRIFQPGQGTRSGSKALTKLKPGVEFDSQPLVINFSAAQSSVSMFVGLALPTGGRQWRAELRAYNINGTQVSQQVRMLGPGPTPITTPMSVAVAGNVIRKVELYYEGSAFETIDDLTFSMVGPAGAPDNTPPQVIIRVPVDRQHLDSFEPPDPAFPLDGQVNEDVRLKTLSIRVEGPGGQERTGSVYFSGQAPVYPFGSPSVHGLIFDGRNRITITAEDYAGNTGSRTITVWYDPLEGEAELLIIAPTALRPPLVWLRSWKNMSGISCNILSLESIDSDPRFSGYRDLPEKIKRAIARAYQNHGTRYVMLVGDGDTFPVRYTKVGHQGVSWGICRPASELYYADLFKANGQFDDWDADGNQVYGEWWGPPAEGQAAQNFAQINQDQCDLRPDVAVGRVPASTEIEVARYVAKVFGYEIAQPGAWFNKALLFNGGTDHANDQGGLDWLSQHTLTGFDFIKCYRPSGYETMESSDKQATRQQWLDSINQALNQGVGFVACYDHGARWTCGIYGDWLIDSLHNEERLPVVFARACDTAKYIQEFDYYMDTGGNLPQTTAPNTGWEDPRPEPMAIQPSTVDVESMAEAFLVRNLSGAVGFIGSHSGVNAAAIPFAKIFFEGWDAGNRRLGDMWNYTVTRFANEYLYSNNWIGKSPFQSHHIHKFLLFGDPSLRLGGIPTSDIAGPKTGAGSPTQMRSQVRAMVASHVEPISKLDCPRSTATGDMTIKGQAQPRTGVAVYEGRRRLAGTTTDDRGNFQLKVKGLSEGVHQLSLSLTDKMRLALGLRTLRVEVHLSKPTARNLRYPTICGPQDFVLTGETEYNGTWVELIEGKESVMADFSRHGGKFILRPAQGLATGNHHFRLRLTDAAGNETLVDKPIELTVRAIGVAPVRAPVVRPIPPTRRPTAP